MSDLINTWPALRESFFPKEIPFERGVWGKAHGASSDFRWLARSDSLPADIEKAIALGGEDKPVRAPFWRTSGDLHLAGFVYPSRASDSSARTQFLEKQVLAWQRPPDVPAAFGALLLLPLAATLNDKDQNQGWWSVEKEFWRSPEYYFNLSADQHVPLLFSQSRLEEVIEEGRSALRQMDFAEESLAKFYAALLAGNVPARLPAREPLPAAALAALLLPLPREKADRLSIAGWVPSNTVELVKLKDSWNGLVVPAGLRFETEQTEPSDEHREQGRRLARFLLEDAAAPRWNVTPMIIPELERNAGTTPALEREIQLDAPPPGAPPILAELYDFARTPTRRWLSPEKVKSVRQDRNLDDRHRDLLLRWIECLDGRPPEGAHEGQWKVKVDLLRATALILFPDAGIWRAVGPFTSHRVPPLLFLLALDQKRWDNLARLHERSLREAIKESLVNARERWEKTVRKILEDWALLIKHRMPKIRDLIEQALADHPRRIH